MECVRRLVQRPQHQGGLLVHLLSGPYLNVTKVFLSMTSFAFRSEKSMWQWIRGCLDASSSQLCRQFISKTVRSDCVSGCTNTLISSVKDGIFRVYVGPRDKNDFITFIEDKRWRNIDPVPDYKHPNSKQLVLQRSIFCTPLVRIIGTFFCDPSRKDSCDIPSKFWQLLLISAKYSIGGFGRNPLLGLFHTSAAVWYVDVYRSSTD